MLGEVEERRDELGRVGWLLRGGGERTRAALGEDTRAVWLLV